MKACLRALSALFIVMALAACQSNSEEAQVAANGSAATGEAEAGPTPGAPADTAPVGENAIVTRDEAAFYRYGPAQASGADLRLSRGTLVTVLKKGKAYSSVRLPAGTTGFMVTRELMFGDEAAQVAAQLAGQSASANATAQGGSARPTVKYSSTSRVIDPEAPAGAPQANAADTPLPDASDVAPTEIDPVSPPTEDVKFPAFRY